MHGDCGGAFYYIVLKDYRMAYEKKYPLLHRKDIVCHNTFLVKCMQMVLSWKEMMIKVSTGSLNLPMEVIFTPFGV